MKNIHICLKMTGSTGWIGGAIYIQNLTRAITSLPIEERSHIKLTIGVDLSNLSLVEPVRRHVNDVDASNFLSRFNLKIRKALAEKVSFIPLEVLNPKNFDFVYPDVAGARAPYPWAGWIPDFQHYHLPHLFPKTQIDKRNRIYEKIARFAPAIVLSSQMAQADFKDIYPEAGSRSKVMNFASHIDLDWFNVQPKIIQEKYHLPDYFFLISNQFGKHKDHATVIESLGLLKRQKIAPTVVCTGNTTDYSRNSEYYPQLLTRIEELGLKEQVRILGLIPRLDQIQLMRRCLAVIQPSLFEGWSTVVEDGRALGKSMLLSDFPVHLEQNPPYSHFFEQGNSEQLATLISTAISNLSPGPDLQKENLAKHENQDRISAFGRRFLEIVNAVI